MPSILFPGVPGQATPGAFSPGDPGSTAPAGGGTKFATAQITAKFSLTANGQIAGGTTKFASASITASFSLTASSGGGTAPAASIRAVFSLTTAAGPAGLILQQVQGASAFDYGLSSVEISTSPGSTLVVLAGWDLSVTTTAAPMPAVNVTDSAANLWIHAGTTSSSVTGSRCSAWICPSARAIEWLSVSSTTFVSSLAYVVLELNGGILPPYYSLDIFDANSVTSSDELALRPGSTVDNDFAFAAFTTGGITSPPIVTSAQTWQALPSATSGTSDPNPVQLFPFIAEPVPGVDLETTFSLKQALPLSAVVFAVRSTVFPPYQANPNMPLLQVEMGFGYTPGDPSQPPPVWTDITNRVIASPSGTWIATSAGRQYELASPEAGTIAVTVLNADSAFDPSNETSPFWPFVLLKTPVRVNAWWNGIWYSVAYGWVERWPQAWPDLPQYGTPTITATDAVGTTAAVTMFSALDSDILLDNPYVLIPANEQYLSFSNGLNSFSGSGTFALGYYTAADAQGLLAQNYSRFNQRNGLYVDGNSAGTGGSGPAIAATGQTTNLLGTANTGFGTTSITTAPTAPASGPGLVYTDPNMPGPLSDSGVTVSFWVIISGPASAANLQPVVFTAWGPPSNYQHSHASLQVLIQNFGGAGTLQITFADNSTITAPFTPAATPQLISLVMSASFIFVYVNGSLEVSTSLTAAQTSPWQAVALGCPNYAYQVGNLSVGNFTAFDLSVTGAQLPVQRIVSQFATGIGGQQGVDACARVAQILAWANLGVARAGRSEFNGTNVGVLQGPAYSLAGTTASSALAQVAANESGMVAATPTGAVEFIHSWALYDQEPVVVFGDDPDPTQGQIPYLQAQSWDYDDTYLWNTIQVTQEYGANNLFTVQVSDTNSQAEYFARTPRTQTITTLSSLDPADAANWQLTKYSQPNLRVSGVTIDAYALGGTIQASSQTVVNPAFGILLGLQQGQVATVVRTPAGGSQIVQNVIIQRISHKIGPQMWQVSMQLAPYVPEGTVLQLDSAVNGAVGSNTLA